MDLVAIKATAASIAMVLVILQGLIMLQLYGKARILGWRTERLAAWHRQRGAPRHCLLRTAAISVTEGGSLASL